MSTKRTALSEKKIEEARERQADLDRRTAENIATVAARGGGKVSAAVAVPSDYRLWGRAIRELQDGQPERILEAIDTLPIPTFAQKVLKTLAAPQKKNGRPAKRTTFEELELTEEFSGEWLQLLQDGKPDSKATAIEIVSERHGMIGDALRGIVEKHRAQYAPIMKSIGKLRARKALPKK